MTIYSNPGHIADVVGTSGRIEATWGNAVRDRLNGHFGSTADRDSAFPTPNVGCVAYVDGSPPSRYEYNGTTWVRTDLGQKTYTPQVDQGASTNISKSIVLNRYMVVGGICHVWVSVSMSGAGTAGSPVTVTLPVAENGFAAFDPIGVGQITDSSAGTNSAVCEAWLGSSSTVYFQQSDTSSAGRWGQFPNIALASGDAIRFAVAYPINA